MKRYNSGQLRDKCEILEMEIEQDEYGFIRKTYVVKYALRCFISSISNKEWSGANQDTTKTQSTVIIRKKKGVTTKDFISINEEIYNIVSVIEQVHSQYMELKIEKREFE